MYSVLEGACKKWARDSLSKGVWQGCYKSRNQKSARKLKDKYPQHSIGTNGHSTSKIEVVGTG